jgi:hypothetical protein
MFQMILHLTRSSRSGHFNYLDLKCSIVFIEIQKGYILQREAFVLKHDRTAGVF